LRGDVSHQREQARFALYLQNEAASALHLAQENRRTQKEPADTRILLEAAIVAKDAKPFRYCAIGSRRIKRKLWRCTFDAISQLIRTHSRL
jgi:hypothetical protein